MLGSLLQAPVARGADAVSGVFGMFSRSQPDRQESVMSMGADSVQISAASRSRLKLEELLQTYPVMHGAGSTARVKTLAEIGQEYTADLAGFESLMGEIFRQTGFDTSIPFTLQPDGKGSVQVLGEHPQGRIVQSAFDESSKMTARFMVMAARGTLLEAAEAVPGFRDAYRADGVQAVHTYENELKDLLLSYQMRVSGDGFEPGFGGA
jgi:hypothetical protein